MREITTTLDNILSLIACAQDYGFEDNVLFDAFAEMIGRQLSHAEIIAFADAVSKEPRYGPEDEWKIRRRLIEFKVGYCPIDPNL